MKRNRLIYPVIFLASISLAGASGVFASSISRNVIHVVDTNPDPAVFEAEISADEQAAMIDGVEVHALIYKDVNRVGGYPAVSDGIPVPQIDVNVGDEVIVTLTNNFDDPCSATACDTSIHWHGVELDNDSDGTGVTQNALLYGQSYIYRFKAPRPGVFWFHPHMKPGPQAFAGVYGAFIVHDPNEPALAGDSKIPAASDTYTIVLSDIEFDGSGNVGYFYDDDGDEKHDPPPDPPTPRVFEDWATLRELCGSEPFGDGNACKGIVDGNVILVNGQDTASGPPVITAHSGTGIRLRLLDLSTNRYFRLGVEDNGSDNNLYRIGGEGGFLEFARLEGGTLGGWDTEYDSGEIMVPASGRSDVVIVPTGSDGDIVRIVGREVHRGGPIGTAPAVGDLLHIEIDDNEPDPGTPFAIANGSPILGAGGIEDVKSETISDFYIPTDGDPSNTANPGDTANPGYSHGTDDPEIRMYGTGSPGHATINGVVGHYEHSGPDYKLVPYQDAARFAKTGDLLEFTIANPSTQHHPFHHHGFSFQPVRVIDMGLMINDTSDDTELYDYDYNEWVDVIDVPNKTSIVVRMRLDDRERITDNRPEAGAPDPDQLFLSGGAAGRWVFHCHLFLHAAIGMISELVVEDTDRDLDGYDTSMDCDDFNASVFPGAEECDASLDNNCDGVVEGDTTAPDITAPDDVLEECTGPGGQAVDLGMPSVLDNCDVDPMVENDAPALFPMGSTLVTWTATDDSGNFASDTQNVTVQDTTAPEITVEVSPDELWVPNHKMVTVTATVEATDICDPNPTVSLLSVTSSEDDDGIGDGSTADDIEIIDDFTVNLRAERSGTGTGRVYTLTYQAEDASGNKQTAEATVWVPRDQD